MKTSSLQSSSWRVPLAFATVYLVWGTTYFVIGTVVHSWPPFLMTGLRFLAAGSLLYTWRRWAGAAPPTRANWIAAGWISALLLLGGYGMTAWAQQRVPSGLTALMVSITPLLIVLIEWLRPGGRRPPATVLAGLAVGMTGMALLIGPARLEAAREADLFSVFACLAASACWAAGSVFGRNAKQTQDVFLAASMQMLVGTVWLFGAAALAREFAEVPHAPINLRLIGAWVYLTVAGSLGAFTAYIYLLKVSTPARVSTYAYVNPVIAVFVGWLLGGEIVTFRVLLAAGLLLGGVALITARKPQR